MSTKDDMLRSKFWSGLRSDVLKSHTRHKYDSVKTLDVLLREIRAIDAELNMSHSKSSTGSTGKTKTVQHQPVQHPVPVSSEQGAIDKLSQQMSQMMERMKALERKLDSSRNPTTASRDTDNHQPPDMGIDRREGQDTPRSCRGYTGRWNQRGAARHRPRGSHIDGRSAVSAATTTARCYSSAKRVLPYCRANRDGDFGKKSPEPNPAVMDRLIGCANEGKVSICGIEDNALIDGGSMITCVAQDFYNSLDPQPELHDIAEFHLDIQGPDGSKLPFVGYIEAEVSVPALADFSVCVPVLVAPMTEYNQKVPVIVGTNIIRLYKPLS